MKTLQNIFHINKMKFAPATDDGDELLQSINKGRSAYDDSWDLKEEVDASSLEKFWDEALSELGPSGAEN